MQKRDKDLALESYQTEIRQKARQSGKQTLKFLLPSGALTPILENRGARNSMIFLLVRTIIRIRSPRLEASSQQDNVGKGSRQNRSVTLGKGLALRAGFKGIC